MEHILQNAAVIVVMEYQVGLIVDGKIIKGKGAGKEMKVGNFEIKCTNCGSEDVIVFTLNTSDDADDEELTMLKCGNCLTEAEVC